MFTDMHTHSRNSFDAENETVAERCEAALKLGLDAMAITDHCEANRFYDKSHYGISDSPPEDVFDYRKFYEDSVRETVAAKELFGDRLTLICGVELGQATADDTVAELIMGDKNLDFIIGSMHELPGMADFFFLDYSNMDIHELMTKNFSEILRLCKQNKFDVLGHLTYCLRYIEGEQGIKVDIGRYRDAVAEIFKEVIKNGKGIEINTSGLRQKYGRTFPDSEYIKLYRDLGGKIITFGSDSHSTADLGKGIRRAMELAKAAGFSKGAYYLKHEPVFFDL